MASIVDFTNYEFSTEQIRSVKELLYDEVIKSPEYQALYTIYPNIVYNKEVGFIGKGSLVGVAKQSGKPTPQDYNIGTRKIVWEPKAWEVLIAENIDALEATAAVYCMKKGANMADLTDTDYMAIVLEVLVESVKAFCHRCLWFSKLDAKNFKDGGVITDNIDIKYFNLINGFFAQMEEQAAANPNQLVAIAENAKTTYAAQALDPTKVQGYLEKLVYNAPLQLRSNKNRFILCTQSVYDAYEKSLSGAALESMYRNLVDGQTALTFKGIPVIAVPAWDETIAECQNNGTKLHKPHRAVFTSRDYLGFGVDDDKVLGELNVWYERADREMRFETFGKIDAKVVNPAMFVIAE